MKNEAVARGRHVSSRHAFVYFLCLETVYFPGPMWKGKLGGFRNKGLCECRVASEEARETDSKRSGSLVPRASSFRHKRKGAGDGQERDRGGFRGERKRQLRFLSEAWGAGGLRSGEEGEAGVLQKEKQPFYRMCEDFWAIFSAHLIENLNRSCICG